MGGPKPCMGYPTQKEAIEALHEKGIPSSRIASMTGVPINSVTRAVNYYRIRTGNIINTHVRAEPCRDMISSESIQDYAFYNWKKARAGAKDALKAFEFGPPV